MNKTRRHPSIHNSFVLIFLLILFISPLSSVFAVSQLSVPLDHRVYTVLQSAELRGVIPHLPSVRPYSTAFILEKLEIIRDSDLSSAERDEIDHLITELSGEITPTEKMSDMLATGSYQAYSEKHDVTLEVGANATTQTTLLLSDLDHKDLRNSVQPYIKGDIKDILSFSMNVALSMDRLDSYPFLDGDFSIPCEGFYMDFLDGGKKPSSIPMDHFYTGFNFHPEIGLSLWDGLLDLRWGAVHRDWGVGTNNLMLAGQAAPFEGIEGQLNLTDWLRINFVTGSLGGFALGDGIEGNDAFFPQTLHSTEFSNNFSANRVEVDLPLDLTFGIYESVVWIKRFEIGYLNPFAILMLQQSTMGDFDNVLAGFDMQWRFKNARFYGSMATTEMNSLSPSNFFTWYRNILAYQGGVDVDLPLGNFSKFTFQYTKLSPFFYTHYPRTSQSIEYEEITEEEYNTAGGDTDDNYIASDGTYYHRVVTTELTQTSYVNKGFSLGYPIYPNSDEFLISTKMGISPSLHAFATLKYQRRSAQYGYALDMSVNENYRDMDDIGEKNFSDYLFEKTVSLELGASKSFEQFPVTLYGSYRIGATTEKDLDTTVEFDHTPTGEWSDLTFDHVVQFGVTIYP